MTGHTEPVISVIMGTKVIQVTNIAPQATRDQMQTLFGYVGKIEEIRLYPTMRDVSLPVQSRICYVKYFDPTCVGVAQHLTNTVFIDRALIVTPYQAKGGEIPDEYRALDIANQANVVPGLYPSDPKLPAHIVSQIEGMPPNQVITTHDPVLASSGLPAYPPLPITYDARRIEEIRRTLLVIDVHESITGEQLVEFFQRAGDVKYVRFCTRDNDSQKYALVEFSEQSSIVAGLKLNGCELAGKTIRVYHSTQAIAKPMAKSNETAQREIEEAMTRVKEAQSMISAAIDPVIGILSKDKKRSRSRSRRSRSRRRSGSRSKYRRRSPSRSRRSKRRSRSRPRRSRSRGRRRSPSRDRKRLRRSISRRQSRDRRRSRSRPHSKTRKRRSKDRRRSTSRSKKSRSKSKSRRQSRSKSKTRRQSRSKSKSRRQSRSKSKTRHESRSKSKSRRQSRSKSKTRRQSRSKSKTRRQSRSKSKTRRQSRSISKTRHRSRSQSNRSSRSKSRRPAKEDERPASVEKRSQSKSVE